MEALNREVRGGLSEKVTSEQRQEVREGGRDNPQRPLGGGDQRVLGLSEWQELGSERQGKGQLPTSFKQQIRGSNPPGSRAGVGLLG